MCEMQATACMFAVMNGFIIATILSSASSRHRYKERMDMIVVSLSFTPYRSRAWGLDHDCCQLQLHCLQI